MQNYASGSMFNEVRSNSKREIIMFDKPFDVTDSKNSIKSSEFIEIEERLEKTVTDINTAITSINTIINNLLIDNTKDIEDIKDKLRTLENRLYHLEISDLNDGLNSYTITKL